MTRKSAASEAVSEATTSEDDVSDEDQRDVNGEDNVSRDDVNGEINVSRDDANGENKVTSVVINDDVAMASNKDVVEDERKDRSREPTAKRLRGLRRR